jgi:uncharacterized BrkB/YihY/UPF0761 family membrane protein
VLPVGPAHRTFLHIAVSRSTTGLSSRSIARHSGRGASFAIYGLVFDPTTVEPQLQVILEFLPPAAFTLIADRGHTLVSRGNATLGFSLLISTAVALWSFSTGTKSLLSSLNMAYEEQEGRSFLRFQAVGLLMTLCGILGAIIALTILVFSPLAIEVIGLDAYAKALLRIVSLSATGFVCYYLSFGALLFRAVSTVSQMAMDYARILNRHRALVCRICSSFSLCRAHREL